MRLARARSPPISPSASLNGRPKPQQWPGYRHKFQAFVVEASRIETGSLVRQRGLWRSQRGCLAEERAPAAPRMSGGLTGWCRSPNWMPGVGSVDLSAQNGIPTADGVNIEASMPKLHTPHRAPTESPWRRGTVLSPMRVSACS